MGPLALALALLAGDPPPPVIVHLADGTSVPLADWTLSYEYLAWPQGGAPVDAVSSRTAAREIWLGKRRVPAAALTLDLGYVTTGEVSSVRELAFTPAPGRPGPVRPEAPHRELIAPDADRKTLVTARSLDLFGQTLTGTRREFCLLSYSVLVQCGTEPGTRVVKVEFP
jgi:hypothetical protein